MKQYPPIVSFLLATVLLPFTATILVVAALRGRIERRHRERLAEGLWGGSSSMAPH